MKAPILCLMLILFAIDYSVAQLYDITRRPQLNWYELNSPNFRIIFHEGQDSTARAAARILEDQYPAISSLFSKTPPKMPVVLNAYNQLSNGYVTPFNYRIEVEVPPIRGKTMNPQSGSWMEMVMPHELVHAAQFSVMPRFSFAWFMSIMSPDFGRSVQSTMDSGFLEGLAVHHESNIYTGESGRGNYPYFNNQFNAAFGSRPWTIGQMLTPPGATLPGDRFYIGGHQFVDYLFDQHGEEVVKSSVRGYSWFPFVGFAPYLWYNTGMSPISLEDDFYRWYDKKEQPRIEKINIEGPADYTIPVDSDKNIGLYSQPLWMSNQEILVHGSFYNARPGFYSFHTGTKKLKLLFETTQVEDFIYSYDEDSNTILYARYKPHALYDGTYESGLYEIDLNSRKSVRIENSRNLYAPSYGPDQIFSLKTDRDGARWMSVSKDSIKTVASLHPDQIIQVEPNPIHRGMTAVIMKRNGMQALWFVYTKIEVEILRQNPDIVFPGASVFDAKWSPDGMKMLFSSDYNSAFNIYEYDLENDEVHQLTNSRYNAMEASFSPDMSRIAFISQEENLKKLALMDMTDAMNREIPREIWQSDVSLRLARPRTGDDLIEISENWTVSPYKNNFRWLKPRAVVPIFENKDIFAVALSTSDVLRRHALDVTPKLEFGNAGYLVAYTNGSFYPGFFVESALTHNRFGVPGGVGGITDDVRRTKVFDHAVGIPLNYKLDGVSRYRSFSFVPSIRYEYASVSSDVRNAWLYDLEALRVRFFTSYFHKLAQPVRDAQPNRGWVVATIYDHDLSYRYKYNEDLVLLRDIPPLRALQLIGQIYLPVAPLYNQSLKVTGRVFTQNRSGYNIPDIFRYGFNNYILLDNTNNAYNIQTRYTIPVMHPDNGSFLLPWYMERIYLTLFTNTISNFSPAESMLPGKSRTFIGGGIRFRNKFKFITYEIGLGIAWEPTRDNLIFMTDF